MKVREAEQEFMVQPWQLSLVPWRGIESSTSTSAGLSTESSTIKGPAHRPTRSSKSKAGALFKSCEAARQQQAAGRQEGRRGDMIGWWGARANITAFVKKAHESSDDRCVMKCGEE